jgi:hypothetical protein
VSQTSRFPRAAWVVCLGFLAACGGDGSIGPREASIRAVAGAGISDTIDAKPLQALVVEVRGAGGQLAPAGTLVRFEAQPNPDPRTYYAPMVFVCPLAALTCGEGFFGDQAQLATDETDAQGRAKVTVRLGHVAGKAVVRLVVPELGLADSATFTVKPGALVGVRAEASDTTLQIGGTAVLRGHVVDRYDNARPELPTIAAGGGLAITVDPTTGTVTGQAMGNQALYTRYGAFADTSVVHVVPNGRLVLWSSEERVVRLVNLDGTAERTLVSNVSSDFGAFPTFDATRQRVTLHTGTNNGMGPPNDVIVIDTTGSPRRDIGPANALDWVIATRQLADGSVLVVGQNDADTSHPDYSLWRVATDNTITFMVALPGLGVGFPGTTYGSADISHNGSRVAYIGTTDEGVTELRVISVSSGAITVLDATSSSSPRWSAQDDRIAYLTSAPYWAQPYGAPIIINADGTGRIALGTDGLSPGMAWSPDGKYLLGRGVFGYSLTLYRLSDGVTVTLGFRSTTTVHDYWQPDWR